MVKRFNKNAGGVAPVAKDTSSGTRSAYPGLPDLNIGPVACSLLQGRPVNIYTSTQLRDQMSNFVL